MRQRITSSRIACRGSARSDALALPRYPAGMAPLTVGTTAVLMFGPPSLGERVEQRAPGSRCRQASDRSRNLRRWVWAVVSKSCPIRPPVELGARGAVHVACIRVMRRHTHPAPHLE